MPAGLQVFVPDGKVWLDETFHMPRVVKILDVNTVTGTFTLPSEVKLTGTLYATSMHGDPMVVVSGRVLTWKYLQKIFTGGAWKPHVFPAKILLLDTPNV